MGAESEKSKEMLKDSETQLSSSIEESINKVVMEVNK
jgi:succinyl-CoA synthetase beta subunit